jgi:hypothetical protein
MTGIGESQEFRRTITEIASYRESAEDGAAGRPMPDEKAYMAEHGPEAWAGYFRGYQESQRWKNEAKQ